MTSDRLGKEAEVSGYERLRRLAVGPPTGKGEGYGWSVLLTGGMLAWLRALASHGPLLSTPERAQRSGSEGDVPALGEEIIQVLTNMALASRS